MEEGKDELEDLIIKWAHERLRRESGAVRFLYNGFWPFPVAGGTVVFWCSWKHLGVVGGGVLAMVLGISAGWALSELETGLAEWLSDFKETSLFEEACNFLGVNHRATNEMLRKAIQHRRFSLDLPLNRGGSVDEYYKLRVYASFIMKERNLKV